MHFLLLGASGRTGKRVVAELLAQGHTAVALVRSTSRLESQNGLTIVTGSPLSRDDIRTTLTAAPGQSVSAAIMTLNTVRTSDNPFAAQVSPPRFLADAYAAAAAVLEGAGVRRVVIMSTAAAGDSWGPLPAVNKAYMGWTNVRKALADHNLVDHEIRATSLDWTLVRPGRLEYDAADAPLRTLGSSGKGMGMTDSASVASVATFLIQVAVEGLYIKEAVVVVN